MNETELIFNETGFNFNPDMANVTSVFAWVPGVGMIITLQILEICTLVILFAFYVYYVRKGGMNNEY